MTPLEQFNRAVKGPWRTSGLDVQWRWNATTKVLAFQCTRSRSDWFFNMFAARIELDGHMVHAGFAALWESVRDEVASEVGNAVRFRIEGYSQGAAIATLAHAYFQRIDLEPYTTVYGSPRVFASPIMMDRFENIQTRGDIVCHVRSNNAFRHVGNVRLIGPYHYPNPWDHEPDTYRKYLK